MTRGAIDQLKAVTGAMIQLHDLSNPTLAPDYDPYMSIREYQPLIILMMEGLT